MNKIFTLLALILLNLSVSAQTYYSENFNASTSLPVGYTQWNLDSHTVASQLSSYNFGNNAWIVRPQTAASDRWVISTSWYSPVAAANDWLVTPDITIPNGSINVLLTFETFPYNANYPDQIEVKIDTTNGILAPDSFTTTLYGPTPQTTATTRSVDLTAYVGKTFRLAFINNSNDKYILGLDNIKISSVPDNEVKMEYLSIKEHHESGSAVAIAGTVRSLGFNTLNTADLWYSVNGGTPVQTQVSAINKTYNQTYNFSTNFSPSASGVYDLKVWFNNPNNSANDPSDDTLSQTIFVYTSSAQKKVLIEGYTGAWCGYCPEGHVAIEGAVASNPYLIPVSIHHRNGGSAAADQMQVAEGDTLTQAFANGFPSITFDRYYFFNRADWTYGVGEDMNTPAAQRYADPTPVNISLINKSYDTTTRELNVTVKADFLNAVKGDFRLNVILTEDSLTGTGSGWDQENYYGQGCGADDQNSTFYNKPCQIPGYLHRHVLRDALGGAWGAKGNIPTSVSPGGSYTQSFTYTVPASWKNSRVKLIGTVQEYNSDSRFRTVLNIEETTLLDPFIDTTGVDKNESFSKLLVYPNPATERVVVQFNLIENANVKATVYNTFGQKVKEIYNASLNSGEHTINWITGNATSGIYFLNLDVDGKITTKQIAVTK